jgi:hypothetical protein
MQKGIQIPEEWIEYLRNGPETGMGYQVVSVKLRDGRTFEQVVVCSGWFTQVRGYKEIPFREGEVVLIKINHKRWDFQKE